MKKAKLDLTFKVPGFEVKAVPIKFDDPNYEVWIYPSKEPTKKYRYKEELSVGEVSGVFKELKTMLEGKGALNFVKGLTWKPLGLHEYFVHKHAEVCPMCDVLKISKKQD